MKNQENNDQFENRTDSIGQKRKWVYSDVNTYTNFVIDKNSAPKKCAIIYDYENYQPNHQFSSTTSPSASINGQQQQQQQQQTISATNENTIPNNQPSINQSTMEIGENIEYVNILYDENLLTGIQAPVATETNYINFESNWNNTDILDLDQRNYYYETSSGNVVDVEQNLNDLNEQLSHDQHQQHTPMATHTYHEYHIQSHQHQNEQQQNQFLEQTQSAAGAQQKQSMPVTQNYESGQNMYVDSRSAGENPTSNLRE